MGTHVENAFIVCRCSILHSALQNHRLRFRARLSSSIAILAQAIVIEAFPLGPFFGTMATTRSPPWLKEMSATILQHQFEEWKVNKQSTSSHAFNELEPATGLWRTPATEVSPTDPRIEEGTVIDLLSCTNATDQPKQFYAVSMGTMLTIIPVILEGRHDNFDMCRIIHEVWMDPNNDERDSAFFVPHPNC